MGILSQIFGGDRSDGQFRSAMQHLSNRVDQSERNSGRIQILRNSGVSERDRRSLKVYFVTNSRDMGVQDLRLGMGVGAGQIGQDA